MIHDSNSHVSVTGRIPANVGARRRKVWRGIAVSLVVTATGLLLCKPQPSPIPPAAAVSIQDEGDQSVAVPKPVNPGYVGPEVCGECHAARLEEFRSTRHYLACCLPDDDAMPRGFSAGHGQVDTRHPGLHFEMLRRGDTLVQESFRIGPNGQERTISPIAFVYGSRGTTDEVYFTWHGDRLYELPVVWLHATDRWGTSPINPHAGGDFSREVTPQCLECHTTWFGHIAGTMNQYRRDGYILGVTCERCHGPGREHVDYHRARPEARVVSAIVHPGRLTRDRQMDLCAQCHANAVRHRRPPFSYRPGEPLDDYFRVLVTNHPEDDHVANQVQYLRQSKCFQKSESLTCLTCHDPHRRKDPASARGSTCFQCHQPAHCTDRDRLPYAVRDDCVGCHMPLLNKIQVSFDSGSDLFVPPAGRYEHRIGVYPAARQEVLLAWYRTQSDAESRDSAANMTRSLSAHWLSEAEHCRQEYRFLAAAEACRRAMRIDPAPATKTMLDELLGINVRIDRDWFDALHAIDERRYADAITLLEGVLAIKPDWARAHGKLGMMYAVTGRRELAAESLRAVSEHDPDDPYGEETLGWLAYIDGRAEEALEHYRRADEVQPFNAMINYKTGLAYLRLRRWSDAIHAFQSVLTIDPRHAGGCQALADALRQSGRSQDAIVWAEAAARLTDRRNPDVLLTLADVYASAGRRADALTAAEEALLAAQSSNPQLLPVVRQRLETLRESATGDSP